MNSQNDNNNIKILCTRPPSISAMTAMAAAAASRALLRRRGALIPGLTGWMAAAAPSRLPAARQERREIHVLPRGSLAPPGAPSWPDRDSPVARTMWPTARRTFRTEADFHAVADEALETIQDAIDEAFEEGGIGEGMRARTRQTCRERILHTLVYWSEVCPHSASNDFGMASAVSLEHVQNEGKSVVFA